MSNGNSDVKLVHGQVKVEAWDLCVDSKDRRKNETPHRRALVHNFNDGLTINYANDYPAGVTISGEVNIGNATINSEGRISNLLAHKIRMNGPLHALLTVKPGGGITKPPPTSDEIFEQTSGASLGDLLQIVEQGVTEEFNIKVDIVDAVAELSRMVLWLRNQLQLEKEKMATLRNKVVELKQTLASVDDNWRSCPKCQGLFFAGNPTKGVCPAGGEHSLEGSGSYRLLK